MTEVAYLVISLLLVAACGEYDRLAGALGFTERTVIDVLLARGSPRHGGPCSATCTSRTSWKPTRSGASVRRRQVDPVLRDGASR